MFRYLFLAVFFIFIHLPSASSVAAPRDPATQSAIEQQQKALLDNAQQQRNSLRGASPVLSIPDTPAPDNTQHCFAIRHIQLTNSTVLPSAIQRQLTILPDSGCMTLHDIQTRVRAVTQAYLSRGYITSQAWLPEQDISTGELSISVTEGKVEDLRIDGHQEYGLKMLFPHIKGAILNLRDMEQGLEQLNRLQSRTLIIDILPGTQAGFSRIELVPVSQRFPVSLNIGGDNSGQKSTGTGQFNATLMADNLLSLADQWTLSGARDSEFHQDRRSRSLQAGLSVPYGYWLFSGNATWNDFYQMISVEGTQHPWRYGGNVRASRLAANRMLVRDGNQRLSVEVAFSRRQTTNHLGGVRLDVSSSTLSSGSLGINYTRSIGGGYLTFNPLYSRGFSFAGAPRDNSAYPDLPRHEFRRISASASWFYPLSPSWYWLTSAYGQTSLDNLYGSERLSVGGQYSVRGFKEQYLSGNRGGYWRNELNKQLVSLPNEWGTVSLTGAVDIGHVVSQRGTTEGGTLSGASLGLALTGTRISQSLTLGAPLSWPGSLSPDKYVVYWQATVSL